MPPARTQAEYELQQQRTKLANSYQSLLDDFSSAELHSVGNYTLGRLIGKGSFGKVYIASHKLINGSKVVLKSAKKDDANLAREIHHHRQFLHPHIARLYEVIVTESLVWLVLEYCSGDELYHHLSEHGRMQPAKAQKVFTQLVGAVSYVHSKSCVHRDLKLENILLDKHGDVKLVDFGFTREYQGTTSYLQTWCGTVCYSAPEMLRGEKYAGEKVDVWSLGIIMYALLSGELPFDDDDDTITKARIIKEEPKWPSHFPDAGRELVQKLLSKRPLLRPSLADILKEPWLAEYAPQQQETLKLQQPAAFSTQVEKDTLQRMRSAGVDIDMVIENVLSQRCDPLAGWWALLIEKEQRKEKRRDRKRRERDAEAKSIRRLSAASSRLLASSSLLEIQEGEEVNLHKSPSRRGRRMSRAAAAAQVPDLPQEVESKTPTPTAGLEDSPTRLTSRSRSRPAPPPKDVVSRRRNLSRGSGSMLRYSTLNPDLLTTTTTTVTIVPQVRKRGKFSPQPLKEQLAWLKHLFRDSAKRAKYLNGHAQHPVLNGNKVSERKSGPTHSNAQELRRGSGPTPARPAVLEKPVPQARAAMPPRPRLDTNPSLNSVASARGKRTSLSPATLTPHSSYRRASGLRGRKSTSSSVSSIRTAYHQHTHSKASSTSSTSMVSPSGVSSASGSRMARSPHSSVKLLPSTPTGTTLPSSIRVSRKPVLTQVGTASTNTAREPRPAYANLVPGSPSLPVFARRKRSVFKGPMGGSPAGFGRVPMPAGSGPNTSRSNSIPGRRSGEVFRGITEEDEEDEGNADGDDIEEVDHFGPELSMIALDADEAISPLSPLDGRSDLGSTTDYVTSQSHGETANGKARSGHGSVPLTAEALAEMEEQESLRLSQNETCASLDETPAGFVDVKVHD